MIEIGRDQFRRVEIADASGEVLLTIERLASGNAWSRAEYTTARDS